MCTKKFISRVLFLFASLKTIEAVLNSYDTDFFGKAADEFDWSKHPCRRKCIEDEKPKICKYVFVIEQFSTMGKACYDCPFNITDCYRPHCLPASGVQKTVFTANRQIPGPSIEVCLNDMIVVEARNGMLAESTTLHWHGIPQKGTPYMDGVGYVGQCPILPGQKFQYIFSANVSGTYFWHSHIGSQRTDGLFGPLIIRSPSNQTAHDELYDYDEHSMIINKWSNTEDHNKLVKQYYYTESTELITILVNGLGRFKQFKTNNETVDGPVAVFKVKKSKRYRFRIINSGAKGSPIVMTIDNHTMLVISLDGNDIEPVKVDAITTSPGERVDFVLKSDQESKSYWIRYRDCVQCNTSSGRVTHQVAILRYSDASAEDPKTPIDFNIPKFTTISRILNRDHTGTESLNEGDVVLPLLNAMVPNDPSLTHPVDEQIFIVFDYYQVDDFNFHRKHLYGYNQALKHFKVPLPQFNHISLKMPSSPIMSQWDMLKPNSLCNESYVPGNLNCTTDYCACTHVIKLKLNSIVELVFIDQGGPLSGKVPDHPLHLHGFFFRVVAEKKLKGLVTVDRFKELDKEGKVERRLDRAPLKDTMKTPVGGYTIVRVYADNPGYWLFHCHYDEHMAVGMALIFKVGEHEDFPPVPKNFPTCGDYTPLTMK